MRSEVIRFTLTTCVVGTNIEIHNNGLLGEGKIYSFYLDVSKIIGNFHFFHCSSGNFGFNISS